jgi:hypothetical protein
LARADLEKKIRDILNEWKEIEAYFTKRHDDEVSATPSGQGDWDSRYKVFIDEYLKERWKKK